MIKIKQYIKNKINKYKRIKNGLSPETNFSKDISKRIEEYKFLKLEVLKTMFLDLENKIKYEQVEPTKEQINELSALKYLIEKKTDKKDFRRIVCVAIITPIFSTLVSIIISLMIKR